MQEKLKRGFRRYLSNEIAIDFKACVYFFCVLFFYCVAQVTDGVYQVKILTLVEMLLTCYVICNIQVYGFDSFDEADRLDAKGVAGMAVCTALYTAAALLFGWFGGHVGWTAGFAGFIVLCYICVILCYLVKRRLDTRHLNNLLEAYKQNEGRQ